MKTKPKTPRILIAFIYWIQSSCIYFANIPLSHALIEKPESSPPPLAASSMKPLTKNALTSKKILVRSIEASTSDYLEFVENHPDFSTPLETQSSEKEKILKHIYKLFEFEFLQGDTSKATKTLKQITSLALDHPFSKAVQDIIFISFFRLAQLEPSESLKWIKRALDYNISLNPNPKFIPISLIEKYKLLKSRTSLLNIFLKDGQLINGSLEISQVVPNAIYRIDHLNSLSGHRVHFVTGKKIDSLPPPKPLAKGDCHQNSLISPTPRNFKTMKDHYVFLGPKCAPKKLSHFYRSQKMQRISKDLAKKDSLNQKWEDSNSLSQTQKLPLKKTSTSSDLQWTLKTTSSYPSNSSISPLGSSNKPLSLESIENKSSQKKTSKWIYILSGLAAVALGAVIIDQVGSESSKPKTYKPNSNKGFN